MTRRRAHTGLAAAVAVLLGATACGPGADSDPDPELSPEPEEETVAEFLYAWDETELGLPTFGRGDPPRILADGAHLFSWYSDHGGGGVGETPDVDFDDLEDALEEHFLVAASYPGCAGLDAVYLEEVNGEHIIRVDYAAGTSENECFDQPRGTEVWQVALEHSDGELPAGIVSSIGTGDQEPESLRVGSVVSSEIFDDDFNEILDKPYTSFFSTQEDLDELLEAYREAWLPEFHDDLEELEELDLTLSSLVLVRYEACGGAWVELDTTQLAESPVLNVTTVSPMVDCAEPMTTHELWEIPDVLLAEDAVIELRYDHVDA